MTNKVAVELRQITKCFRTGFSLNELDLQVFEEELFCLIGPSGSGKSTVLGLIGGWIQPDAGTITISACDVTSLAPYRRPIRACFQKGGYLFPHLSVGENVGYALYVRGCPKNQIADSVNRSLRDVGLRGFENRAVLSLSGGEAQRVSIARALADPQPILLLDEVTAGLDRPLRAAILGMLESLVATRQLTVICVTHDVDEAFRLCSRFSSRLGVINDGKLEQIAAPEAIYSNPASSFVASLVGDVNLLPVVKHENRMIVLDGGIAFGPLDEAPKGARWLAVRPEHIYFDRPTDRPTAMLNVVLNHVDTTGPFRLIQATVNNLALRILLPHRELALRAGQECVVFVDLTKVCLLER